MNQKEVIPHPHYNCQEFIKNAKINSNNNNNNYREYCKSLILETNTNSNYRFAPSSLIRKGQN